MASWCFDSEVGNPIYLLLLTFDCKVLVVSFKSIGEDPVYWDATSLRKVQPMARSPDMLCDQFLRERTLVIMRSRSSRLAIAPGC